MAQPPSFQAEFASVDEAFAEAETRQADLLRSATPASGPRLARIQSCRDAVNDSSVVSGRPKLLKALTLQLRILPVCLLLPSMPC